MLTHGMPRHIRLLIIALVIIAPVRALTQPLAPDAPAPYEQEFILTAYYSPEPGQCCYVLGGERADKVMNGEGIAGADSTSVYPGMVAAPSTYAFGTRIALPGIGIVGVHDRGGAIVAMEHADRLDVWVGYGEEGLARALAFGVQRVRGTVYPVGTQQPEESLDLSHLPSPPERLRQYVTVETGLLGVDLAKGDTGLSVLLLQEALTEAGFPVASSGTYDADTVAALRRFLDAMGIADSAETCSARTAALLLAAHAQSNAMRLPQITEKSSASDIASVQRMLRYLGYYHGRTSGAYDVGLRAAILAFQREQGIIASDTVAGAGIVGPTTRATATASWRRRRIAERAEKYLLFQNVADRIATSGLLPDRFLSDGSAGDDVTLLQNLLAAEGYFDAEKVNGNYGPATASAVIAFQLDHGIIDSPAGQGAGVVGPTTLRKIRRVAMEDAYLRVRSFGLKVL